MSVAFLDQPLYFTDRFCSAARVYFRSFTGISSPFLSRMQILHLLLGCGSMKSKCCCFCRGRMRSRNVAPSCTVFWCCFSEKCQQTCLCEEMTKNWFNMHEWCSFSYAGCLWRRKYRCAFRGIQFLRLRNLLVWLLKETEQFSQLVRTKVAIRFQFV